jgi:hypothetical protein
MVSVRGITKSAGAVKSRRVSAQKYNKSRTSRNITPQSLPPPGRRPGRGSGSSGDDDAVFF